MDQPGIPAAPGMFKSLLFADQSAQFGVDLQNRLAQKYTSQFLREILAAIPFPADAKIHNPMVVGLVNVMFHYPGRDDDAFWLIEGGINLYSLIQRQKNHLIPTEKDVVDNLSHQGDFGHFRQNPAGGVDPY
jgi:hypothetical protein